jgi:hypothetical protein
MSTFLSRWPTLAFTVGTLTILSVGCAVTGGGYGYDGGGIGAAYYEPYGGDYGGWGTGYQVAPVRGGYNRPTGGGGQHAYRSASASRAMPSIPSGSRSGGSGSRSSGSGSQKR